MTAMHDVIAAFTDGELVDPVELTEALARPDGREHLIDLLALRGLITGQDLENRQRASVRRNRRAVSVVARRVLAAAAVLAIGVLGGFVAGRRLALSPAPSPASAAVAATPAHFVGPSAAPEPTRVIRLENGVDWTERAGERAGG